MRSLPMPTVRSQIAETAAPSGNAAQAKSGMAPGNIHKHKSWVCTRAATQGAPQAAAPSEASGGSLSTNSGGTEDVASSATLLPQPSRSSSEAPTASVNGCRWGAAAPAAPAMLRLRGRRGRGALQVLVHGLQEASSRGVRAGLCLEIQRGHPDQQQLLGGQVPEVRLRGRHVILHAALELHIAPHEADEEGPAEHRPRGLVGLRDIG
eukprot:CAMPEP_0170312084 /NCGR_PEP_ID=MMETSP0116_2-20130129/56567_1 /TAXON_ID=400756 /ORGANISM="Durinskia baltica, Strain CSIRO CS-38" /LENGTH=207 /DNA_ID=CAMNT_0010564437 /DNA_START=49 /DNA_END=670 /DNA_ORIENTATION=-